LSKIFTIFFICILACNKSSGKKYGTQKASRAYINCLIEKSEDSFICLLLQLSIFTAAATGEADALERDEEDRPR
jgi:hypothetical protein